MFRFHPTPGAPDTGNIFQDLDIFKRKVRLNLFFSQSIQDAFARDTPSGDPFELKLFKLQSAFNPVGSFQIECKFSSTSTSNLERRI